MTPNDEGPPFEPVWEATLELRFMQRGLNTYTTDPVTGSATVGSTVQKILQQKWRDQYGAVEWRDVPTEAGD